MENLSFKFVMVVLIIWNIIVFLLYGLDKFFAKKKMYRISEKTLLGCAVALGGVGAFMGMRIFRHKTKHNNFKVTVPATAIITIVSVFIAYQKLNIS